MIFWEDRKGNEEREEHRSFENRISRDLCPEVVRWMLQNGRESMVGAVEEVMNCVINGMAKEWGTRDQEEKESEENGRQEGKEA